MNTVSSIVKMQQYAQYTVPYWLSFFMFNDSLEIDTAVLALSEALFGEGRGPILLDEVRCTGTESKLLNCTHNGILSHDCDHTEDASVICLTQRKLSCVVLSCVAIFPACSLCYACQKTTVLMAK